MEDQALTKRPMRLAAGGLLLLSSVFNAMLALGFLVGGDFYGNLGGMLGAGDDLVNSDSALLDTVASRAVFGQFLFVSSMIVLVGGVSIYASRLPKVIFLACGVALIAAMLSISLTSFGIPAVVGILGCGLGCISALRIQLTEAEAKTRELDSGHKLRLVDWIAIGAVFFGLLLVLAAAVLSL